MDYEAFASDLAPHRTIVFRSPEEDEETMRCHGVTQELRQLGTGKFRCGMTMLRTEQADLYAHRINKAFSMLAAPPTRSVGLLLLRSVSGYALASGENGADDKLLVVPDGPETDIVGPDLVGSDSMTVPSARLIEMAEALCPARESVLPRGTVAIRVDGAQLQDLRRGVLDLALREVSEPDACPRAGLELPQAMLPKRSESTARQQEYPQAIREARRCGEYLPWFPPPGGMRRSFP